MARHHRSLIKVLRGEFGNNPKIIGAEVGVWEGKLSRALLEAFPRLRLVMVDLWEKAEPCETMSHSKDDHLRAKLEALTRTDFAIERRYVMQIESMEAAARIDGHLDFAFIDACHLYESVRSDIRAWWPVIQSGGILSGHDYGGRGDRKKGWGVKRAVDEFAELEGLPSANVESGLVWWIEKP